MAQLMKVRSKRSWEKKGTHFLSVLQDPWYKHIAERSEDISRGKEVSIIDSYLTDLELSGVFDGILGMVIGRPYGYTDEEMQQLKEVILRKIEDYSFPILFNANVGHVDPIVTIPFGKIVKLDSEQNLFYCN